MTRFTRFLSLLAALLLAIPLVAVTASAAPARYHVQWSDQFRTMQSVSAAQSSPSVNAHVAMTDTSNGQLQHPTVRSDVSLIGGGTDGHVLQVATRAQRFQTPRGPWYGLTNGRVSIGPTFNLAGHKVLMRLRGVGNGKAANMIWPAKGWPWEVDFAEWFPGGDGASTARHHKAFDSRGAVYQIVSKTRVDRTQWHTYGVEFLGTKTKVTGIRYTVDGKPMTFILPGGQPVTTITGKWLVNGRGALAIGKAVPGPRGSTPLSHFDAVQVDWVQILTR